MYKADDRVIIKANRLSIKSRINGQVCRIRDVVMFNNRPSWYRLEWLPSDNPGKEFIFNVHQITWYEHEFILYKPPILAATTTRKGLPDA